MTVEKKDFFLYYLINFETKLDILQFETALLITAHKTGITCKTSTARS